MPNHGLVFDEPRSTGTAASELWPALIGAVQAGGGVTGVVRQRPTPATIRSTRLTSQVAAELDRALEPSRLTGSALAHAKATAEAALRTLERLADDGWRAVVGMGPDRTSDPRVGVDAVAERTDSFDPLGRELSRA